MSPRMPEGMRDMVLDMNNMNAMGGLGGGMGGILMGMPMGMQQGVFWLLRMGASRAHDRRP